MKLYLPIVYFVCDQPFAILTSIVHVPYNYVASFPGF